MSSPTIISINPFLRQLIISRYERLFDLPRKKGIGVLITFVNPCQRGRSIFVDEGEPLERLVRDVPHLIIKRLVGQANSIKVVTRGAVSPTPMQILQIFSEAIQEYNTAVTERAEYGYATYYRRLVNGTIDVITGNDTFRMALLANINPSEFNKLFRRVFVNVIPSDVRRYAAMSRKYPWQLISGKDGQIGSKTEVYTSDPFGTIKARVEGMV